MDVTYLDHNASSPLAEQLLTELPTLALLSDGNPSSPHSAGRASRRLVTEATDAVAAAIGCPPDRLYWTSGASESNTWVVDSASRSARAAGRAPRFLLSPFEHESLLLACEQRGEVELLAALPDGRVDLADLATRLAGATRRDDRPALVALTAVHNETGVIQPVSEAAALCSAAGARLHVDCAQALGKLALDLSRLGASTASFSAHKIGGPKGVGILAALEPVAPFIGGRQQRLARGGTENALGLALTARAVQAIGTSAEPFPARLAELRDHFEARLLARLPGAVIHGRAASRVCNTTYASFEGAEGRDLVIALDLDGVCASTGSACGSGIVQPSRALVAMGCAEPLARAAVRFSSGRATTSADYDRALAALERRLGRRLSA